MTNVDNLISNLDNVSTNYNNAESKIARLRTQAQTWGTNESAQITAQENLEAGLVAQANEMQSEIFGNSTALAGTALTTKMETSNDIGKIESASSNAYAEAKDSYENNIVSKLSSVASVQSYSLEEVSPTLSKLFISQVIGVAEVSAIVAIIGIFLIFRTFAPSLAVICGAFSDVAMAMGAMAIFKIPLTLASFATLMMLCALSLDTDMMLTIKTVKRREGTPRDRAYDAFKTGFAMTSTVIVAFIVLLALGIATRIDTYYQIGAVATAGLIGDITATWMLDAVLVLWYLDGTYNRILSMIGIKKK